MSPSFQKRGMPTILMRRALGGVAVEFALVLVLFLNFSVGAIELSNMYTAWTTVQYICTQTARKMMMQGATGATTALATSTAQAQGDALGYTSAAGTSFTATQAACPGTGTTVCMTISGSHLYRFKLSTLGMGNVTLRAKSVAPLL